MNIFVALQGDREVFEVQCGDTIADLKERIAEEFKIKIPIELVAAGDKVTDISALSPDLEVEVEIDRNIWGYTYADSVGISVEFSGDQGCAIFAVSKSSFFKITDLKWTGVSTMKGTSKAGNCIIFNFNDDRSEFSIGSQRYVRREKKSISG